MEKIKIYYKLDYGGKCPVKLNDPTDAGFDIYSNSEPLIIGEKYKYYDNFYWKSIEYIEYRTGLFIEPVDKEKIICLDLRPRSSISKYWLSLCNSPATIDHTYGSEILVRFNYLFQPSDIKKIEITGNDLINMYSEVNYEKIYKKGDRICQILPKHVMDIEWMETNEIKQKRGGFGSSDK